MPYSVSRTPVATRLMAVAMTLLIAAMLAISVAHVAPVRAAAVGAGYIDHFYGPGVNDPSEDKPQSKVWYNDGSWWAGMFTDGVDRNEIYKYNATTHVWTSTGVPVDERNSSHGDYLWDGASNSLYVASANNESAAADILVFKLNYNTTTKTYAHDPAFTSSGVVVGTGPAETVTIAKDSTGQLWVSFQNPAAAYDDDPLTPALPLAETDRKIMVNRSLGSESSWGTAFQVGANVGSDDLSALIAFNNTLGIMYSEHRGNGDPNAAFHFASHADTVADDTAWNVSTPIAAPGIAEDHINLKVTATSNGQVLAALKTNGGPNHIQLWRRQTNGSWDGHVVVGASQDVSRPQVVFDETAQEAYVFYTSPEVDSTGDQAIYYKSATLASNLTFTTTGLGTPFIQDGANDINNVSTAKHNVSSTTGLVAIASSDTNTTYYHGYLSLGAVSPTPTPTASAVPTATPTATATPTPPAGRKIFRLAGSDRYATAAAVSRDRFPSPAPNTLTVFVAVGANFPDALAAGPAAGRLHGPVLLVRDPLPDATRTELQRLKPAKIIIVGSAGVISEALKGQLQQLTFSKAPASVERVAGPDRYATAAALSARFTPANSSSVFVALGTNFPDALSAAPAATQQGTSILLVRGDRIETATRTELARLKPATIYLLGSAGVIPESVRAGLAAYTDSGSINSVVRLAGPDRYQTGVAIIKAFFSPAQAQVAFVATGQNFPDALTAGPYGLPTYLVRTSGAPLVPPAVATDIGSRTKPTTIYILGSAAVVSEQVKTTLAGL